MRRVVVLMGASLSLCLTPRPSGAQSHVEAATRDSVTTPWAATESVPGPHQVATSLVRLPRAAGPLAMSQGLGPTLGAPHASRGAVAVRGLLGGAIVGGIVGYLAGRHEEYGGAVFGAAVGAAVGAPVGMVVLLLATPR